MTGRSGTLALLVLLVAGCRSADRPASSPAPDPVLAESATPDEGRDPDGVLPADPGDTFATGPVPAGAVVTLECDREEWILGETCVLGLVVGNRGEEPFSVSTGMDYRGLSRHLRFRVSAVHEDGTPAVDPGIRGSYLGGIGGDTEVPPGGRHVEEVPVPLFLRIDRPGTWTFRMRHDFGWRDEPGRPVPVAEIRLRFREPTEEEARRIAEETLAPDGDRGRLAGRYEPPWYEPAALALPRYFPLVAASARARNPRAAEAATWFPTPEAAELLVACLPLLEGDDFERIAWDLGARLPRPSGRTFHPFLGGEATGYAGWDDALAPALRSWALHEVEGDDPERADIAAAFLRCLPGEGDADALEAALDRALAAPPADVWERAGSLPRGASSLFEAWRAAGGVPAFPPRNSADALAFLRDLRTEDVPRPGGWEEALGTLLDDPRPWVRTLAAEASPWPPPPPVRARLSALLRDPVSGVRRAACGLVAASRYPERVADLVGLLGREPDVDVAEEACRMLCLIGARLEASRAAVVRMDPEKTGWSPHLGTVLLAVLGGAWVEELDGAGYSGRGDTTPADRWAVLRERWGAFLDGPGMAVGTGKFRLGDPALAPELFAPVISFSIADRPAWPPSEE